MPYKKQGHITVDAAVMRPIPADAHAALERSHRLDESMPTDHVAHHQPYNEPSARPHPALKHLKSANHVHEVFKKR